MNNLLCRMKNGEFQQIGHFKVPYYYVSKSGDFVSDRTGELRFINTKMTVDSSVIVTLYTPGLMRYNVAELLLSVFERKPNAGETVHYRDGNKANVALSNLFWSSTVQMTKNKYSARKQNGTVSLSKQAVSPVSFIAEERKEKQITLYKKISFNLAQLYSIKEQTLMEDERMIIFLIVQSVRESVNDHSVMCTKLITIIDDYKGVRFNQLSENIRWICEELREVASKFKSL